MKKTILITFCCATLMLVTPLSGVAQENTVGNNLPEQPNDVEGLVAQIRIVIDEILEKYGHIPMVRSLCDVMLNTLDWFPGNIVFCIILIILLIPLSLLWDFFRLIGIFPYTFNILVFGVLLFLEMYCPQPKSLISKLPFESIYTMLETKDNINTFDGCPCLQE